MTRRFEWYKHDPLAFLEGVQGIGPDAIGAYIVLLDLIYARGGECRRDDHHLSGVLGCSKRLAKSLTDRLIEIGKISQQGEILTNFRAETELNEQRMLSERRSNAQRVRRENEGAYNEINELKDKHISVKPPREEKRREERKELPLVVPKKEKNGTRISDDFEPDREWSRKQGLSNSELRIEFEKFKNYWMAKSGKDATKKDWQATWRNWIINAVERKGRTAKPKTVGEGFVDLARDMGILGNDKRSDAQSGLFEAGDTNGHGPVLDLAVDPSEPEGTGPNDFARRLLHRP